MVVKSHDLSEAVKTFIAATSWAISQKDTQNYPGWKKVDFWVKAVFILWIPMYSLYSQLEINHVIQQPTEAD